MVEVMVEGVMVVEGVAAVSERLLGERMDGLPRDVRGVLLFGGTFDPPHLGHVELAARARAVYAAGLGVDCSVVALVFVPAGRSPFKEAGPAASDAQRVEMLLEAIAGMDAAFVWTDELDRAGVSGDQGSGGVVRPASYTVDTVRRARSLLDARGHGVRLGLLIGGDQARGFHRWKEPRTVLGFADVLVLLRDEDSADGVGADHVDRVDALIEVLRRSGGWSEDELHEWRGRIAPVGVIRVSSSMVRGLLASVHRDADRLGSVLPAGVLDVIERDGLYRDGPGDGM